MRCSTNDKIIDLMYNDFLSGLLSCLQPKRHNEDQPQPPFPNIPKVLKGNSEVLGYEQSQFMAMKAFQSLL